MCAFLHVKGLGRARRELLHFAQAPFAGPASGSAQLLKR